MKAIILAAGEGKRLEPLTNVRPKPMIPVGNKPILQYVVGAVVEAGIEEIVLVVGYKRDRIQSYFGNGHEWGVSIDYAVQDKQLGTGDAVLQASGLIDEDFLVLNGDRIIDPPILQRIIEARQERGEAVMAVTHSDEPELYGVVEMDQDNRVRDIIEKPSAHEATSDIINAGVYAFGTEIFQAIRETTTIGELALTEVLASNLEQIPIHAIPYGRRWLDVSRPWDLVSVNAEVIPDIGPNDRTAAVIDNSAYVSDSAIIGPDSRIYPNTTVLRGTAIGDNVSIGPNVTIRNSILMSDATVRAGSVIEDAVVAENVTIGPNTTIAGGRTDVVLQDEVYRDVSFGSIVGDNAHLESSSAVAPGTFVGNGSTVSQGARVEGWIEPHSTVRRG